jgi:hypothetical protein
LFVETWGQSRIEGSCGALENFCDIVWAMENQEHPRKLSPIRRAIIEVGFIIFLFYSNLLMGEFTHANGGGKSLVLAVQDIFTIANFIIAIVSALAGYVVFEYLRKKL